jgi:hypothetical protein
MEVCKLIAYHSISVLVSTPFELIKCKQQLNAEQYERTGQTVRRIVGAKGLAGLYQGFWVTFNRDVLSYGLYFYTYYRLKDTWERKGKSNAFRLMLAGGISGK